MSGHFQDRPHYVYLHLNDLHEVIYVGCTQDPNNRPADRDHGKRTWIEAETADVELSPAMSYEAAAWMENALIRSINPNHNHLGGRRIASDPDGRIKYVCEVAHVTRGRAQSAMRHWPKDLTDAEFKDTANRYAAAMASIQEPLRREREAAAEKRRARTRKTA